MDFKEVKNRLETAIPLIAVGSYLYLDRKSKKGKIEVLNSEPTELRRIADEVNTYLQDNNIEEPYSISKDHLKALACEREDFFYNLGRLEGLRERKDEYSQSVKEMRELEDWVSGDQF